MKRFEKREIQINVAIFLFEWSGYYEDGKSE